MNDLKFALRQLLKNPGFTAVAGLTLARRIGASWAFRWTGNQWLLQPIPISGRRSGPVAPAPASTQHRSIRPSAP